ncbi:MAG: M60 family metallopeptidase [Fimbriimonas sp.]|nr:M60 family metallopeptidase [Fimbriimonas sp.]
MISKGTRLFVAVVCIAVFTGVALAQDAPLTVETSLGQKGGWMPDGWGSFRMTVTNKTTSPAKLVHWTVQWQVKGKPNGDPWGGDLTETIAPGKSWSTEEISSLPMHVYQEALPQDPLLVGSYRVIQNGLESIVPFQVAVPGAKLPEPLKTVYGKTVGLAVMQSRFKTFKRLGRTLKWIDQSYQAMIDLTGERPFNGQKMVFKECPAHPWWAYAGKEMILNGDYVAQTLKEFDDGLLSFGWVHEVGHNFDVLGDWYIWDSASTEMQANFKLAYAFESIPDQSFRITWHSEPEGYPSQNGNIRLTGRQFVERFFLLFGDRYLANPNKKWSDMTSDEIHTLFQRIQQAYGWEPFKAWYRDYRALATNGLKPPTSPEEKVNLVVALLSKECHVNLIPLFKQWRFPVTPESVAAVRNKFGVTEPSPVR